MSTKSRPKQSCKKSTEATADPFPLADEVKTFEAHLSGWSDREGQFVLIKGRHILGFYPRHDEALESAYEQLGAGPFLVKQVLLHEPIHQCWR